MADTNKKADYQQFMNLLHITPDAQKWLTDAISAVQGLADAAKTAVAVIGVVEWAGQMMGFLKKSSAFDDLYNRLKQQFDQLGAKVDELCKQVLNLGLAQISGATMALRGHLMDWSATLRDTGHPPLPDSSVWLDTHGQFSTVEAAADTLVKDPFWHHTYNASDAFPLKYFHDSYVPPLTSNGQSVWDYRGTLAVYLDVWSTYISAIQLMHGSVNKSDVTQLANFSDRTVDIYTMILGGFRLVPCPAAKSPDVVMPSAPWQGPAPGAYVAVPAPTFNQASNWEANAKPCGAVDTYGASGQVEAFPLPQVQHHPYFKTFEDFLAQSNMPLSSAPTPQMLAKAKADFDKQMAAGTLAELSETSQMRRFRRIFLIRSRRAAVALYNDLALEGVWRAAQDADTIGGNPPRAKPDASRWGAFSLDAILRPDAATVKQLSGETLFDLPPLSGVRALLQEIGNDFASTGLFGAGPVSMRKLLAGPAA